MKTESPKIVNNLVVGGITRRGRGAEGILFSRSSSRFDNLQVVLCGGLSGRRSGRRSRKCKWNLSKSVGSIIIAWCKLVDKFIAIYKQNFSADAGVINTIPKDRKVTFPQKTCLLGPQCSRLVVRSISEGFEAVVISIV